MDYTMNGFGTPTKFSKYKIKQNWILTPFLLSNVIPVIWTVRNEILKELEENIGL